MRLASFLILCVVASGPPALAQAPPAPASPATIGSVVVSGSLRTRVESWDWFEASAHDDYAYSGSIARLGLRAAKKRFDWQFELAAPVLLGLPDDAIATGAQGQLGLGAAYYAANNNDRNAAQLFVKQAFARFKSIGGHPGHAITVGRMEFTDGAEATPPNTTLAALKRDRIAQRLLGPFGFSHVGRSMDGVQYSGGTPRLNLTALAARPTRGVFQVDGWRELKVNVIYGALTRQTGAAPRTGEWRAFALDYRDYRDAVVKTDNRPLAVRRGDSADVHVVTGGGHYVATVPAGAGQVDLLFWAAVQAGSWGALSHRAGAIAVEAGWQPAALARVRPWLRVGWNYGSGDDGPADGTHGTFFQILPTPRVYARFPFFNLMNSSDVFAEVVLRPSPRLSARADVHALRLASSADLWYQGGGAFQPGTFGYAGRPSNGSTSLATLYDVGADYTIDRHAAVGAYYGLAAGGAVVKGTYPAGATAGFGYVELTLRF